MKNIRNFFVLCAALFIYSNIQAQIIQVSPNVSMCNSAASAGEVVTLSGDYTGASGATWAAPVGAGGTLATPVDDGMGSTEIEYTLGGSDATATSLVFTLTNNDDPMDVGSITITIEQCPILSIGTPAASSIPVGSTFDVATLVSGDIPGADTYYTNLADAQTEANAVPSSQTINTATSYFVRRDVTYTDPIAGPFVCTAIEEIVIQAAALPLELVSFTGRSEAKNNVLNWITATEENTSHFVVERSANGSTGFLEIGNKVPAAGNASTNRYYSLTDENPSVKAYYRLRMVDLDGRFTYSPTVLLERKKGSFNISTLFPNPTTGVVTLQYETTSAASIELKLTDALGRLLSVEKIAATEGINQTVVDLTVYPAGIYFVELHKNNTEKIVRKVIKN